MMYQSMRTRTVRVPWDGVWDAAEGFPLVVIGELEAVVDAVELLGGGVGHDMVVRGTELLLQNVLVVVGFSITCKHDVVCLQSCHRY